MGHDRVGHDRVGHVVEVCHVTPMVSAPVGVLGASLWGLPEVLAIRLFCSLSLHHVENLLDQKSRDPARTPARKHVAVLFRIQISRFHGLFRDLCMVSTLLLVTVVVVFENSDTGYDDLGYHQTLCVPILYSMYWSYDCTLQSTVQVSDYLYMEKFDKERDCCSINGNS